jgi:uncharacterized protein DUF5939
MRSSSEIEALFTILRQSSKPEVISAIEELVQGARDRDLCRINALELRQGATSIKKTR